MSTQDPDGSVRRISVSRRLEDGWDYLPAWRSEQIDLYLADLAKAKDRANALQTILFNERDPVVRQGLRFRLTGECVAKSAFSWAVRCARDNPRTGGVSMLKAMVLAELPPEFIANELGTALINVVVAERLYFDVRRYLKKRIWLRAVIFPQQEAGLLSAEQLRERTWLSVAFEGTPDRLLAVLQGREDASHESLEITSRALEAIAGRRALEFVRSLDRGGHIATEEDVKRYVLARGLRSREAAVSASEQVNKVKEWGLSLVKALDARTKEDLDTKTIRNAMEILPLERMQQIKDEVREQERRRALLASSGTGKIPSGEALAPATAAP